MTKQIIYTTLNLRSQNLEKLQAIAPNFEFRSPETPVTESEINQVEIMLGWDPVLGQAILDSDAHSLKWIQANIAGVDSFDFKLLLSIVKLRKALF